MKGRYSLRIRIVALVAVVILPLFGMAIYRAVHNADAARDAAQGNLEFAASLVASNQARISEASHQILRAVASAPGLLSAPRAECQRYLKTLNDQLTLYTNLGLIGLDGNFFCDGVGSSPAIFAGDRNYFRDALAKGGLAFSGYMVGQATGRQVVIFSLPVERDGAVAGIAFVSVDLAETARTLNAVALPQGVRFVITDRNGTVLVASPDPALVVGRPVADTLLTEAARSMRSGTRAGVDSEGGQRLYAFLPAGSAPDPHFFVATSMDQARATRSARTQLQLELVVLALVAFLGSWLAWVMGGRAIVGPTEEILRATRQIQAGDLSARVRMDARDDAGELTTLATGFNVMAEALQRQHGTLQAELVRSEDVHQKLQQTQRLGRIGYWQLELATSATWWSDETYELMGVNATDFEVTYANFLRLLHPDDVAAFKVARDAAVQANRTLEVEFRIITATGDTRWIYLSGHTHGGGDGAAPTHRTGVIQDITTRKHAEQALIDSEARHAALFESAPVPMWVVDDQTQRFIAVNEACVRRYGYTRAEFLGMSIFDIRSELEARRLKQALRDESLPSIHRWLHLCKDGTEFPVDTLSHRLQYAGRTARFVVAVDMTAQVLAEKTVQAHLFTLQRAADATQAITCHRTLEATLREVVEQARAVVGAHQAVISVALPGEQVLVTSEVSCSSKYPHCKELVRWSHESGMYAGVYDSRSPMRLTQPELEALPAWLGLGLADSQPPPMRGWLAVPLTGHNGETIGLLQLSDKYEGEFTAQDQYVSVELSQLASIAIENAQLFEQVQQLNRGLEEKVAERTAALARQAALSLVLAEQAPQVVWNADAEGRVTYANRKWYELMGGSAADWMGLKWLSAIHPDDRAAVDANWQASRRSLKPYEGMRRFLAADGTYHTMSYSAAPVLDEQGAVLFWVGIDADVTDIKAIEAALRLSNQELEAFSYSVSHDLRSPLNTVDGFSRLLAKQLDAGQANEKVQHYLSRIQAGVAQMGQLIEDLLSLAQVSRIQLRHETVDLSALAHEIADEYRGRNPERVASIHIENGLQAQGDRRLLRVVMENLLGNAWKFTSQLMHADIHIGHTLDAAGLVVFLVRDNGAGFDMAYADKLFNTFQRLHAAVEFPGSGVGLATVSRVISRHGGRVWAEAAPDKGASFFFTLPGAVILSGG